jgi:putative DNA primase/helicase
MFNMLDHIDLLAHRLVKESPSEYRYLCPVCDNDTLTVKKHTSPTFTAGAYQCWAGCQCHEIREAMGVRTYNSNTVSLNKWKASKPKEYPPVIPPQHLSFIPVEPRAPSFRWDGRKRVMRYNYSPTQYTERIESMQVSDDGELVRDKTFRQYSNGRIGKGNEPWDMYLWNKIPLDEGNLVVVPEGEKSVQAWWLHGIAATCPQGSCWTSTDLKRYAQQFKDKSLYPLLIPDTDLAGERKRDKWLEACREVGLWSMVLDLRELVYWQEGWDSYELLMLHTTYTLGFVKDLCNIQTQSPRQANY